MVSIPDLQASFGQVLRELRTASGLSQQQLALESDLDRTYISLLERGLRQPTLGTIFQIAQVLDLSPSKIVAQVEKGLKKK